MRVQGTSTSRIAPLRWFLVAVATVLSVCSVAGIAQTADVSSSAAHTVFMREMSFDPPEIIVRAGDIVEWKNEDMLSHTVTADDGSFDSGLIAPGQSWNMTVKKPGVLRYHCRPHPKMTASLVSSSGAGSAHYHGAEEGSEYSPPSLKWQVPTSPQQIHPILVNFTAALLPLALFSDLLGRMFRRQSLHDAAWWMVLYAAVITPLTVAAGWWWKHDAGPDLPPKLIAIHQWLGTSAALAFVVLAVWRWSIHKRGVPPSIPYLTCSFFAVLVLMYQGSLGGSLVFGK